MIASPFNKRKSFQNQNGAPQLAKKVKQENVTPKKPNSDTPHRQPNQQQKGTPKPNFAKKEFVRASAETPKPKMFGGTANLTASAKKELASVKQASSANVPANAKGQIKKEPNQNAVGDEQAQINRHKRRREKSKHRRADARTKARELRAKVAQGDVTARREIEEKVKQLENVANKSKNCEKKLREYQRVLSGDTTKPWLKDASTKANTNQQNKTEGNTPQNKKGGNKQKSQQITVTPKNQQANQKKPQVNAENQQIKGASKQQAGGKLNQMSQKGKQNQNLKMQAAKIDSDSDEEEEESDSEEEVMAEADSGEEEQSSDLEVASDEDKEEDENEEVSGEEEEGSNEEHGQSSEEEAQDSDDEEESSEEQDSDEVEDEEETLKKNQQAQKNTAIINKKVQQQVANKNKQGAKGATPKLEEIIGKDKKSRYVVFVGNLPYTVTREELTEHFSKVGEIADVRIPTNKDNSKPKGFAYVEVKTNDSYQRALSLHHTFVGGRRINVLYSEGGKKKTDAQKGDMKAKNFKLQALRNQGMLTGSVKADQKRSVRRAKKQQFEKRREGA